MALSTFANSSITIGGGGSNMTTLSVSMLGIGMSNPTVPLHVVGNARVQGNLTVNGTQTIVDTNVNTTERLDITNDGTGPALRVTQLGAQPIADFYDDSNVLALRIADGGAVGVGTSNPASLLAIAGNASVGAAYSNVAAPSNGLIVQGNLGVGTSNPVYTLDTKGSIKAGNIEGTAILLNDREIKLRGDGYKHYSIYNSNSMFMIQDTSSNTTFGVNGQPLIVCSNNYIGVGTSNPQSALDVNGQGRVYSTMTVRNVVPVSRTTFPSLNTLISNGGLSLLSSTAGDGVVMGMLETTQSGSVGNGNQDNASGFIQTYWDSTLYSSNQNTAFCINPYGGNVGIANQYPLNTLTVGGNASVGSSYANATAPTNGLMVQGNVGIGTSNPQAKLEVTGDICCVGNRSDDVPWNNNFRLWNRGYGGYSELHIHFGNVGGSTPSAQFRFMYGNGFAFRTARDGFGYEYAWTTIAGSVSSEKYKKDIQPLSLGLTDLLKLKPVEFKWKIPICGAKENEQSFGFIAEEMERINKMYVKYNLDGVLETVDYPILTSLITKAIQELYSETEKNIVMSGMTRLQNGTITINIDNHLGVPPGTFQNTYTNIRRTTSNETSFHKVISVLCHADLTISCEDSSSNDEIFWQLIVDKII